MLFTLLREAPGRIERRLFPGLRDAEAALPADATDADIALSVWRSLRLEAMQFGEGVEARRVLPGRLTVTLPQLAFDAYAGKRLMSALEASVVSRVTASAGAEGFTFAEGPVRIEFARASEDGRLVRVQVAWPVAATAAAASAGGGPAQAHDGVEGGSAERTYLAFEKAALQADLFALDIISAGRALVVRHFVTLGARSVGFNADGRPVTARPAFRLALSGHVGEAPGWVGMAPEWGVTEWRHTSLDRSTGRRLADLFDAERQSWTTGDETERLTVTDDVVLAVGRSLTSNDIGLPDDHAITSMVHLIFIREPDGRLAVADAGSSNGTLLNGRPLPALDPSILNDGDVVSAGSTLLRVGLCP